MCSSHSHALTTHSPIAQPVHSLVYYVIVMVHYVRLSLWLGWMMGASVLVVPYSDYMLLAWVTLSHSWDKSPLSDFHYSYDMISLSWQGKGIMWHWQYDSIHCGKWLCSLTLATSTQGIQVNAQGIQVNAQMWHVSWMRNKQFQILCSPHSCVGV